MNPILSSQVLISTVDVAAVLPEELQSVGVVVLHRLRHVDDVSVSVVIPAHG